MCQRGAHKGGASEGRRRGDPRGLEPGSSKGRGSAWESIEEGVRREEWWETGESGEVVERFDKRRISLRKL